MICLYGFIYQLFPIFKMNAQKKLVQLFKNFVDRVFVPQLKRVNADLFEWGKFSTMISTENLNYQELQAYVDTLGSGNLGVNTVNSFERKEQIPMFKKRKEDTGEMPTNESAGFNPSKTFGGERARMMFPLKNQFDDSSQQKDKFGMYGNFNSNKDDQFKKQNVVTPQVILPGLERLCKTFIQNQQRIQNLINSSNMVGGGGNKYY